MWLLEEDVGSLSAGQTIRQALSTSCGLMHGIDTCLRLVRKAKRGPPMSAVGVDTSSVAVVDPGAAWADCSARSAGTAHTSSAPSGVAKRRQKNQLASTGMTAASLVASAPTEALFADGSPASMGMARTSSAHSGSQAERRPMDIATVCCRHGYVLSQGKPTQWKLRPSREMVEGPGPALTSPVS